MCMDALEEEGTQAWCGRNKQGGGSVKERWVTVVIRFEMNNKTKTKTKSTNLDASQDADLCSSTIRFYEGSMTCLM